jgi:hypothetical protein
MRKADEECLEEFADALEERGFYARRYEPERLGELWAAAEALHSHCIALDNSNQRKALDMTIFSFVRAFVSTDASGLNRFSEHDKED